MTLGDSTWDWSLAVDRTAPAGFIGLDDQLNGSLEMTTSSSEPFLQALGNVGLVSEAANAWVVEMLETMVGPGAGVEGGTMRLEVDSVGNLVLNGAPLVLRP
jgi:hypothetical protein